MPPAAGVQQPPVAAFLRSVTRSRLVEPGRLNELAAAAPGRRAGDVADHLVKAGALTRFQADKLLGGFWQGLLVGPYRLLCPLGRGGMGLVYLARDDRPDAPTHLVALKVLAPQRARTEPRTLARFRREMEIGTGLPAHPHLARTTDAGEANGLHFLAMEYVPGSNVRQEVAEGGTMPVGAACRAFADAAAGLAVAHAAGFVHRDFKPANVIVTPLGRGKVLDFGFALRVGETNEADPEVVGGQGYTLGTMDFIAPEQTADASKVGPPADVYALGCSLFYTLTGCPPFPGGGPQEKIRWHRASFAPPITQLNPTVPAELDRLVRWFMAKDPAARPAADRAAKELAAWADPIQLLPPGTGPTAEDLVRAAEARWQKARGDAPPAEEDDAIGRGDADDVDVELVDDDEPPVSEDTPTAKALVRLPVERRVLVAVAVAAAVAFFVVGFLAGLIVGRR